MEHPTQQTEPDGLVRKMRYTVKAGNQVHETITRTEAVKLARQLSRSFWGSVSVRSHDKVVEMTYRKGLLSQYSALVGGGKHR